MLNVPLVNDIAALVVSESPRFTLPVEVLITKAYGNVLLLVLTFCVDVPENVIVPLPLNVTPLPNMKSP